MERGVRAYAPLRLDPASYPLRLRDLAPAPSHLWLSRPLPEGLYVGIVGTREPTDEAAAFARELAVEVGGAEAETIADWMLLPCEPARVREQRPLFPASC